MLKPYFVLLILIISVLSSCTNEDEPEEVIKSWLTHKSKGECEAAFDLEIDAYHRIFSEYECEAYQLEIKDVNCTTEAETAVCECYETRKGKQTELYYYDLKKVDGVWKVQPGS